MSNSKFKKDIYDFCVKELNRRYDELKNAISLAQDSVNKESKSTAGDKHDTSRAMAQLEVENLSKQLNSSEQNLELIKRIDPSQKHVVIGSGSLIETNQGYYFISVGLGKVTVDNQTIFVISLLSPIGKLFHGKKVDDEVIFNQQKIEIKSIN